MFGFLQRFKKKPPEERTLNNSEHLTRWELDYIKEHNRCPDCGDGKLYNGPTGGGSINVRCEKCTSDFCFGYGFGELFDVMRISDAKKGDPDRARLYGLEK